MDTTLNGTHEAATHRAERPRSSREATRKERCRGDHFWAFAVDARDKEEFVLA